MFTKEKYCAVCGCPFSLPLIRNPQDPDPNEDAMLALSNPYDSRLLPRELTTWLPNFRVVGRWREPDPLFLNVSSIPDFFISPPARWQYGDTLEPAIPSLDGKERPIMVYESTDAENGMLSPIHQACLDLVNLMCETRKGEQSPADDPKRQPQSLKDFCDRLEARRSANMDDALQIMKDHYYGSSGGIEWAHGYFGARQFWTDEWDTAPGWEWLCADPASTKIPNLAPFILSALPQQPHNSPEHQRETGIDWLFPPEREAAVRLADQSGGHDWVEGTISLREHHRCRRRRQTTRRKSNILGAARLEEPLADMENSRSYERSINHDRYPQYHPA